MMFTGSYDCGTPKKLASNLLTENTMGNMDSKYKVMKFKANYGYISAMKKVVDQYIKLIKSHDPDTIVLEEVNDDKSKTWVVGNSKDITRMVNDALKSSEETII